MSKTTTVRLWLSRLEQALEQGKMDDAVALFGSECYWRDLVSLTWNSTRQNRAMASHPCSSHAATFHIRNLSVAGEPQRQVIRSKLGSPSKPIRHGEKGHLRLREREGLHRPSRPPPR